MKKLILAIGFAAFALAGCGQKREASPPSKSGAPANTAEPAASPATSPDDRPLMTPAPSQPAQQPAEQPSQEPSQPKP